MYVRSLSEGILGIPTQTIYCRASLPERKEGSWHHIAMFPWSSSIERPEGDGNGELLTKELLKIVEEEGLKTELPRPKEYNLKPYGACVVCRKTKKCRMVITGKHR